MPEVFQSYFSTVLLSPRISFSSLEFERSMRARKATPMTRRGTRMETRTSWRALGRSRCVMAGTSGELGTIMSLIINLVHIAQTMSLLWIVAGECGVILAKVSNPDWAVYCRRIATSLHTDLERRRPCHHGGGGGQWGGGGDSWSRPELDIDLVTLPGLASAALSTGAPGALTHTCSIFSIIVVVFSAFLCHRFAICASGGIKNE